MTSSHALHLSSLPVSNIHTAMPRPAGHMHAQHDGTFYCYPRVRTLAHAHHYNFLPHLHTSQESTAGSEPPSPQPQGESEGQPQPPHDGPSHREPTSMSTAAEADVAVVKLNKVRRYNNVCVS